MPVTIPDWLAEDARYAAYVTQTGDPGRAAGQYGAALFQAGDATGAARVLEVAVGLVPAHALYWGNYGVALAALGRREAAVEMFNRSLSIDPDQYRIWLNLAHTLMPLGQSNDAAEAFNYALNHPDTKIEALTGLGLLAMAARDYEKASGYFLRAKALGGTGVVLSANIGASAFQRGHVGEALVAYEEAAVLAPNEAGYRDNMQFLRMLHGVMTGAAEQAVTAYAKPLADDTVLQSAFRRGLPFLTSFGHLEAARALAKEWLGYYPQDIEARYLSAVLNGTVLDRAPQKYLMRVFDRLADAMDDRFFDTIEYHVPEAMAAALERAVKRNWKGDLLDAGCGTGILGKPLKPFAKSLNGIDLSPRMLEQAARRDVYNELVQGDMVEYLTAQPHRFDAIFAADVLIYKGTLDYVFKAAHLALKPGGLFVFDVESLAEGTYELLPSGRFRHAPDYVRSAAEGRFSIVSSQSLDLRKEAGRMVAGTLYLMKRK